MNSAHGFTEGSEYTNEKSVKTTGWTSVKDRIPDYDTDILICFKGSLSGRPVMKVDRLIRDNPFDYPVCKWMNSAFDAATHNEILWMPLPEPPKM